MTNVFALAQVGYQFYEDGTEAGAVALGTEDTPLSLMVTADRNILLRIQIQESGSGSISGAATDDYRLERSIDGGAFAAVTTSSTAVQVNTASALTDQGATTARLVAGGGSFVAGKQDDGDGIVTDVQLTANNYTEHVFGIKVLAASTSEGTVLTFRLTGPAVGTLFTAVSGGAYTVTPTLNITEAQSFTASPTVGALIATGETPTVIATSPMSLLYPPISPAQMSMLVR